MDNPLQKAIALVTEAIGFDGKREWLPALERYIASLVYFGEALKQTMKAPTNDKMLATMCTKTSEYLDRAEKLEINVLKVDVPKVPVHDGSTVGLANSLIARIDALKSRQDAREAKEMKSPTSPRQNSPKIEQPQSPIVHNPSPHSSPIQPEKNPEPVIPKEQKIEPDQQDASNRNINTETIQPISTLNETNPSNVVQISENQPIDDQRSTIDIENQNKNEQVSDDEEEITTTPEEVEATIKQLEGTLKLLEKRENVIQEQIQIQLEAPEDERSPERIEKLNVDLRRIMKGKDDILVKIEMFRATANRLKTLETLTDSAKAITSVNASGVLHHEQVEGLMGGVNYQLQLAQQQPIQTSIFLNEDELQWVNGVVERVKATISAVKKEEESLFERMNEADQFAQNCVSAMKENSSKDMQETLKTAALLALKRKKMYAVYVERAVASRNSLESQDRILENMISQVKILKSLGESAGAMNYLREKAQQASEFVDEKFAQLKELEKVLQFQSEDGSFVPEQEFADTVETSLENIQTTIPESLNHIEHKEKIWSTIIAISFIQSRLDRLSSKGRDYLSREVKDVNIDMLIAMAKELYFTDDLSGDLEI